MATVSNTNIPQRGFEPGSSIDDLLEFNNSALNHSATTASTKLPVKWKEKNSKREFTAKNRKIPGHTEAIYLDQLFLQPAIKLFNLIESQT